MWFALETVLCSTTEARRKPFYERKEQPNAVPTVGVFTGGNV